MHHPADTGDESFESAIPVPLESIRRGLTPLADPPDAPPDSRVVQFNSSAPQPPPIHLARALPSNLDAEESVLACCLIDEGVTLAATSATHKLRPIDFYDPRNALIFEMLLAMQASGVPISTDTLASELTTRGNLERAGGFPHITQVSAKNPTTAQAAYFAKKVKDQATLREIIRAATAAVEDCYAYAGSDLRPLTDDLTRRLTFAIEGPRAATDWPPVLNAAAIAASPPAIPPALIAGILYEGGTMLISGPSKSHKTFTVLDLCIAIATGGKWLGHQCSQHPCLYLNLELQAFANADRIARISTARGVQPPENLHVWNLRGHTIDIASLRAKLPEMIKKTGAKVVCIDPHYKVSCVSGMEENSNDAQGELLTLLEGICILNGATLTLTHHFAKGDASSKNAIDRASGGGVFARWGDVMLTFTPHEEDDAMTVEMSLRNFAPIEPFAVRWTYPRWQRDDELDPSKLKRAKGGQFSESVSADRILEDLGDQSLSAKDWMKATGVPERTFFRRRQELVATGKVVCVSGLYRRA